MGFVGSGQIRRRNTKRKNHERDSIENEESHFDTDRLVLHPKGEGKRVLTRDLRRQPLSPQPMLLSYTSPRVTKHTCISSNVSNFELLPIEIIQKIFVYSENCDLPSCSPFLYRILSGSRFLQLEFVKNACLARYQHENKLEIPESLYNYRFVTFDLLDTLIGQFECEMAEALNTRSSSSLPKSLQQERFNSRKMMLILFLLQRDLYDIDEPDAILLLSIRLGEVRFVAQLINLGCKPSNKCLIYALQRGDNDIIHQLLECRENLDLNGDDLWDFIFSTKNSQFYSLVRHYEGFPSMVMLGMHS